MPGDSCIFVPMYRITIQDLETRQTIYQDVTEHLVKESRKMIPILLDSLDSRLRVRKAADMSSDCSHVVCDYVGC